MKRMSITWPSHTLRMSHAHGCYTLTGMCTHMHMHLPGWDAVVIREPLHSAAPTSRAFFLPPFPTRRLHLALFLKTVLTFATLSIKFTP